MKIFQNKPSRSWKSSGVSFHGNQMEMSGFSFAEDYFKLTKNKFIINIIAKNIIGNGLLVVSVYKEKFLVWQESIFLRNIGFVKKTIEIEEQSNFEYKIVISRGRESKGKILIDSVIINEINLDKKIEELLDNNSQLSEDEPTIKSFDKNNQIENNISNNLDEKTTQTKSFKFKIVGRKKILKNKKENLKNAIEEKSDLAKPPKNKIWVMIIDFSEIKDERLIFKYLNQISFGKGRQVFLVKNNTNEKIDFSKYDHVTICYDDEEVISKLLELNPEKITFPESNLSQNVLDLIKKIED